MMAVRLHFRQCILPFALHMDCFYLNATKAHSNVIGGHHSDYKRTSNENQNVYDATFCPWSTDVCLDLCVWRYIFD